VNCHEDQLVVFFIVAAGSQPKFKPDCFKWDIVLTVPTVPPRGHKRTYIHTHMHTLISTELDGNVGEYGWRRDWAIYGAVYLLGCRIL
jgi:hypothetical protein